MTAILLFLKGLVPKNLKTYLWIFAILFVTAAVVTVSVQVKKIKAQKAEIARIDHNYKVAQDYAKLVKGENGLLAARIESQSLTINEVRDYYKNLTADIADMKIQLRKVTGITAFNTETTNKINTFFKDSTRINDVPIETLSYSDKWFDIDIRKEGLKAQVTAISRDSLIQVVHWNRTGKFWPTRWLTKKEYYQDIKSMNPNSRITYSKWIVPYKKK
jgi:hypothetical protein